MTRPSIDDSYKPMTEVERELLLATKRPTVHLVRRLEVTLRAVEAERDRLRADAALAPAPEEEA